jgi:hypothetical protein
VGDFRLMQHDIQLRFVFHTRGDNNDTCIRQAGRSRFQAKARIRP